MNAVIVGGGQIGSYVAKTLVQNNVSVRVIEQRPDVLERLLVELPKECVIAGGGSDPKTMEQAGVEKADVLIAVTGRDEVNLVASTIAKFQYGIPRVIARVNNPKNNWLFNDSMGVDVKLSQADLLGHLVIDEIDMKHIVPLLQLNRGNNSIIQLTVTHESPCVNQFVRDISMPEDSLLIAIHRGDQVLVPKGDTQLMAGDGVLALVSNQSMKATNDLF